MPELEKVSGGGGVDTPLSAHAPPVLGRSLSIGQFLHNDPTAAHDEDLPQQPALQKNESFGIYPAMGKRDSNESPGASQETQKSKFALNPEQNHDQQQSRPQ
jgi:hypothetical protein